MPTVHVVLQGEAVSLQTMLVILTREATLWTAPLGALTNPSHSPLSTPPHAHIAPPNSLRLHTATQVDLTVVSTPVPKQVSTGEADEQTALSTSGEESLTDQATGEAADNALTAVAPATAVTPLAQLYGKSISYCPALGVFVAALGDAANEDQGVVWLAAPKPDGTGIGQVAALKLADSAELSNSGSLSMPSLQGELQSADMPSDANKEAGAGPQPPTHSGTDITPSDDGSSEHSEEDSNFTDEDEEDHSDASGAADPTELPNVDRSYAVPLLPVSRQEMQTPGLVLGVPSHGLPGLVAYVFEPAHPDGSGCAVVAQVHDMQVGFSPKQSTLKPYTLNPTTLSILQHKDGPASGSHHPDDASRYHSRAASLLGAPGMIA